MIKEGGGTERERKERKRKERKGIELKRKGISIRRDDERRRRVFFFLAFFSSLIPIPLRDTLLDMKQSTRDSGRGRERMVETDTTTNLPLTRRGVITDSRFAYDSHPKDAKREVKKGLYPHE